LATSLTSAVLRTCKISPQKTVARSRPLRLHSHVVAPIPDTDYRIKLQVFEGPLDLLLFLIRKNELDIYDIPIEQVTRQYLDALSTMGEMKLELAGEFFVMAATLMEIKSRMLLPKHQQAVDTAASEEEDLDPRWELVHQLIQYKKFKDAATGIAEMIGTRQSMLERAQVQQNLAASERPLRPSDRIELWNAFNQVLRRLAEKLVVGDIKDDNITVVDQMEMILKRIAEEPRFMFSTLLPQRTTLRTLVATFLAVLELTRMRKIRVQQDEHFADIAVERAPEPTANHPDTGTTPVDTEAAPAATSPAPQSPSGSGSEAAKPEPTGSPALQVAAEPAPVVSAPPISVVPDNLLQYVGDSGQIPEPTSAGDNTPASRSPEADSACTPLAPPIAPDNMAST
jgi:segregation and condensation protein A